MTPMTARSSSQPRGGGAEGRRTRVANPALRAEPAGIGTAGARDPLSREVKLLGALLGQVIVEQEGPELLELVERVRRRTIALRKQEDPAERAALAEDLAFVADPSPDRWIGRKRSSGPSRSTSSS